MSVHRPPDPPSSAPAPLRGRYQVTEVLRPGPRGLTLGARDAISGDARCIELLPHDEIARARHLVELLSTLATPMLPALFDWVVVHEDDDAVLTGVLGLDQGHLVGHAGLVVDRVVGQASGDWTRGRSWRARQRVIWRLALTLWQMHRAGVIHGRVSPSEVLVDDFGMPVLVGLGAERLEGDPHYRAPECLPNRPTTEAGERYALGALAYRLLAGKPPRDASTPGGLARADADATLEPLPQTVPRRAAAVIERLLARRPGDRPELDELLDVLRPDGASQADPVVLAFAGREALADTALGALEEGRSCWLTGEPGLGKSRFVRELRWRAEEMGLVTLTPRVGVGWTVVLRELGAQLAYLGSQTPEALPDVGPWAQRLRTGATWLASLAPPRPTIILWDDADANTDITELVTAWLLESWSPAPPQPPVQVAHAVVSRLPPPGPPEDLGASLVTFELGPLDEDAAQRAASSAHQRRGLGAASLRLATLASAGSPRALGLAIAAGERHHPLRPNLDDDLLAELLDAATAPLDVPTLALALERPPDAVVGLLQDRVARGDAIRLGRGYLPARPAEELRVRASVHGHHLRRAADVLRESGRDDLAAVPAVLGGDLTDATLQAALESLDSRQQPHQALRLLAALVTAGRHGRIDELARRAIVLERPGVALEALPEGENPTTTLARAHLLLADGRPDEARATLGDVAPLAWPAAAHSDWSTLDGAVRGYMATRASSAPRLHDRLLALAEQLTAGPDGGGPSTTALAQRAALPDAERRFVDDLATRLTDLAHGQWQAQQRVSELEARVGELEQQLARARTSRQPDTTPRGRRGPKPKVTRDQVIEALRRARGSYDDAAQLLGVSARSVYRYVRKWGIDIE